MFRAVGTVVVAHAVAYGLVGFLPRSGVALFGIGAADPTVLARFNEGLAVPRTYIEALARLLSGDFGRTLDQVDVVHTMESALVQSAPLLLVSNLLLAVVTLAAILRPTWFAGGPRRRLFAFVTFLPAYLPGFLLLAAAVTLGITSILADSLERRLCLGLCIGLMPSCLSATTIGSVYASEREQPYVQFLRACGRDEAGVAAAVRRAVLLHWLPTAEKLVTLQFAVLIFTEGIFSYPGFGSMLLLGVQRTDINLILVSVTAIALSVAVVRLIGGALLSLLDPRRNTTGHG